MADYMGYWQSDAVKSALAETLAGRLFDHSVSRQFKKVRPGDTVWIVNIELGSHRFRLVGRIDVAKVCGQREAIRETGRTNLFKGPFHIIAIPGSEQPIQDIPLDPVAKRIRFASKKPADRLTIKNGQIDQMQVRRLRTLSPETVDLFQTLWGKASGSKSHRPRWLGEELMSTKDFFEGGAIKVLVNRHERDRGARDECVAHYGTTCSVCEMEFSKTYGDLGEGLIHVHHIRSVSSRTRRHRVDPIKDLIPVCPNCHAMLHYGESPPSVAKLRGLVRRCRGSQQRRQTGC